MELMIPHPIPYQGSKRNIAQAILSFFPNHINTLIEPFAGSAAISIAAAFYKKASKFYINDINKPLIKLWQEIVNNPEKISIDYEKLWNDQLGREREYYDLIRDKFNATEQPRYFLYLLARCVKASIRYNSNGEFNQSPDNRRKGRNPKNMRNDIFAVSDLLKNKVSFSSKDYHDVLQEAQEKDLIYMDPPYQGVSKTKDPRYFSIVTIIDLIKTLEELNLKNLSYILSYDGKRGDRTYGRNLPAELGLHHIELKVGRSSQSTLLGGKDITYESLYLSPALVSKLNIVPENYLDNSCLESRRQLALPI